jgi:hypothetical protein
MIVVAAEYRKAGAARKLEFIFTILLRDLLSEVLEKVD